jgi:hypothetical protein
VAGAWPAPRAGPILWYLGIFHRARWVGPVSTSDLGCIQALGHISISNFIKFHFFVFSFGIIE